MKSFVAKGATRAQALANARKGKVHVECGFEGMKEFWGYVQRWVGNVDVVRGSRGIFWPVQLKYVGEKPRLGDWYAYWFVAEHPDEELTLAISQAQFEDWKARSIMNSQSGKAKL